ncbi:MAG: nucleoside triphosphate pyrophosphohydrolase [Zetaproteobacteria bacterium]|nr:MAG: nucleoside triphosphate pyrophosphohydrolase [Zetaproteobacteria bacterium]
MPDRIKNKDHVYDKLKALMEVLREECPWDRAQTLSSLRRFTIEETYELLEAIERAETQDAWDALRNELGDLLLHIAFYARLAEEKQRFDLDEVIDTLIDKMIRRHPHVFADAEHEHARWEAIKDEEHRERRSLMDGIPPLPALAYARKLQQRASRVGFDWPKARDVLDKLQEEITELHQAYAANESLAIEQELGDVLFTLVNWARKCNIDAELALMSSNRKFERRFRCLEALAEHDGKALTEMDLDQLEDYYRRAKLACAMEEPSRER